jgi:hypothetical protein
VNAPQKGRLLIPQGTTGFSPSPIKSSALTQPTQQSLRSDIFSTPGETWNGFATEPPKSPDITELTQRMIDDLTISVSAMAALPDPATAPTVCASDQARIAEMCGANFQPNAQKQRIEAEQRTRQDSATFNAVSSSSQHCCGRSELLTC